RHTISDRDLSSDVCSSDLARPRWSRAHTTTLHVVTPPAAFQILTLAATTSKSRRPDFNRRKRRCRFAQDKLSIIKSIWNRPLSRSEERRVGKECRSRGCPQ